MQVMFDTKILKQLDKEIDDYFRENGNKYGFTEGLITETSGMRTIVSRIREIIMEED